MKYILIYILSSLLLSFIWYRGFEIPKRMEMKEYYIAPPPQEMSNDTTILVGVINIITFMYQMRDRKQKNKTNE